MLKHEASTVAQYIPPRTLGVHFRSRVSFRNFCQLRYARCAEQNVFYYEHEFKRNESRDGFRPFGLISQIDLSSCPINNLTEALTLCEDGSGGMLSSDVGIEGIARRSIS